MKECHIELPKTVGSGGFLVNDGIVAEHEALTGDGPLHAGISDGLAIVEITAAAYLSAGCGSPVQLPFAGEATASPYELWRGPL